MRLLKLAMIVAVVAQLAGCDRKLEVPASTAQPPAFASSPPVLDTAALSQTSDPARILRYYASAIEAKAWDDAASVWGEGSGMTGTALAKSYGPAPKTIRIGAGTAEGAAGSLYYEVPIVQRDNQGVIVRQGVITLRRVNDVPGATPAQLRWHIERSTLEQPPT